MSILGAEILPAGVVVAYRATGSLQGMMDCGEALELSSLVIYAGYVQRFAF